MAFTQTLPSHILNPISISQTGQQLQSEFSSILIYAEPQGFVCLFFLLYFVVSWYMVTKWIINVSLQIAKSYCFNPILHLSSFGSKTEATTNIQLNDRHVQNITKHHIRCTYEWKISSSYEQMCSKKDLGGKDVLNFWL